MRDNGGDQGGDAGSLDQLVRLVRRGEKGCGRQSRYHTYADELNMGCEKESKE